MCRFKEYSEAYSYFYGKKNHFMDLGLDNIREFLKNFGSPENKLNIIQIAGTNGKGSVSVMLSGILTASGYMTGRYNSPVVFEERENITADGVPMSEQEFITLVNEMYEAMEMAQKKGKLPTVFELETVMAILFFEKKHCDAVVLEAGLGGEKDATNVSIGNKLSVITSVSLDHMAYLGDTVEKIAQAKSGIIKENSAAAVGVNSKSVTDVIKKRAAEKNSSFVRVNPSDITLKTSDINGQIFTYKGMDINVKMSGDYQAENAALAAEAALVMKNTYGCEFGNINEETIKKGISDAVLRGRFQKIHDNPTVIIDGAHNPDAARRLKENIEKYLKDYAVVMVMGVFKDKDYRGIADIMKPYLKRCVAVTADGSRALPCRELKSVITSLNISDIIVEMAENYHEAVNKSMEMAKAYGREEGKPPAIVVFGSLSYLKYIAEEFEKSDYRK